MRAEKTEAEVAAASIDGIMTGFEPEINEMDRRLFYEVTRRPITEGDFIDEDTSDEE